MIIKVCGITKGEQVKALDDMQIELIGFNFYSKSSRFVETNHRNELTIDTKAKKVGVFVNESIPHIKEIAEVLKLDIIQLHGDESPAFCQELAQDYKIIKALGIKDKIDIEKSTSYTGLDYLLFDTKTIDYGGSGEQFDWSLLEDYKGSTPFLLAGGIGSSSVDSIVSIDHPRFAGVDINSRFEIEPGLKDLKLIKNFKNSIIKKESDDL